MASKRDKILKNAEKLVQKGKLDQAIREYERLLDANQNDSNTVNRLGDLYGRVGEVDKAVGLYERVARQFAEQGFIPKAIAIYKKINRLAPHRLDIFERLGELYVEQGLVVEAKSQFRMLAEHYVKSEDVEGAVRVHEHLNAIDPNDTSSRQRFADLLLEAGEIERAVEAYVDLGAALIQREKLEEAERLFRRLLEHDLPDGEIMSPVCNCLLDAGRATSAQELLTAALVSSPDSIALRTLQVRAFMALGETESAVSLAREVLEVDPENAVVRGLVGGVLMSDGDQEQATEMMIPAAEALLEQADYARAQKMLEELVEVAPTDERVLRLAIRAFRPSGDQQMLTKLTTSLADVCFKAGQSDQARRFYMELVASDPTNQLFRERLARLDGVEVGVSDDSVTSGAVIDEDVPSEIDFVLQDETTDADTGTDTDTGAMVDDEPAFDVGERLSEAAVFVKYGLHDKAVAHLEEVVRRRPDYLEAREELAKQYVAVGRAERAADVVRPVIERLRREGDPRADDIERRFGVPATAAEEDDDVIIVDLDEEIDGDQIEFADVEAVPDTGTTALRSTGADDVEELVARAMRDLDRAETASAGGAEAAVPQPAEVEAEAVEEELVEITAGVDGPSRGELAQLDLFIEQELFDDARGMLARLESEYQDDGELAERRAQLESVRVTEKPAASVEVTPPAAAPGGVGEDEHPSEELFDDEPEEGYIDLARELEQELAEEEAMVEEATGRGKGEAMLEEVFREFQRGVAEQLSEDDSDTHFNLGIAYKEMGLLEEAIREFKVASHDPAFFVEACTMIGVCCNELGHHTEAAEWYQKALVAPNLTFEARTALRYELASAFEKTGEIEQAVDLFEEIQSHDPTYRDVGTRLSLLAEQQRQIN